MVKLASKEWQSQGYTILFSFFLSLSYSAAFFHVQDANGIYQIRPPVDKGNQWIENKRTTDLNKKLDLNSEGHEVWE